MLIVLVSFPEWMKAVAQKLELCQVKPKFVKGFDVFSWAVVLIYEDSVGSVS